MSWLDKGISGTTLAIGVGGLVLLGYLASLPNGIANLKGVPRDWPDLGGSSSGVGGDPLAQLLGTVTKTVDASGTPVAGGSGTITHGTIGAIVAAVTGSGRHTSPPGGGGNTGQQGKTAETGTQGKQAQGQQGKTAETGTQGKTAEQTGGGASNRKLL